MKLLLSLAALSCVCGLIPEEAAQIEVIDAQEGSGEGIYIKVNGEHKDNKEEVYMQVNLKVNIEGGSVLVNDHILPFSELTSFYLSAQIGEVSSEGVTGELEEAQVKVNFFLHEQTQFEGEQVARAFRLETQIIETDKYDVHMYNVTEVVLELDSNHQELRRTVTLISESESKLHKAKHCTVPECRHHVPGCTDYKKDENGCATCECAAAVSQGGSLPGMPRCLRSCEGVCGSDPYTVLEDPVQDPDGCWICPCVAIDTFAPVRCDFGRKLVQKFEELPYSLRMATILMLSTISLILTVTCVVTVCCRPARKQQNKKQSNLKAYNFGKLQIYVPDTEKKTPLIDNLDVVSADIA